MAGLWDRLDKIEKFSWYDLTLRQRIKIIMAGLWERVKETADDNVQVNLLGAAMTFYANGNFTRQQILNAINDQLQEPLTTSEQNDLAAIADQMDLKSQVNDKLIYGQIIRASSVAAEVGAINETQWRAALGIS